MMAPSNQAADQEVEAALPMVSASGAALESEGQGPSEGPEAKPTPEIPTQEHGDDSDVTLSSEDSPGVLKKLASGADEDFVGSLPHSPASDGPVEDSAHHRDHEERTAALTTDSSTGAVPSSRDQVSLLEEPEASQSQSTAVATYAALEAHQNALTTAGAVAAAYGMPTPGGSSDRSMANSSRSSGSATSNNNDASPPVAFVPVTSVSTGKRGKSQKSHSRHASDSSNGQAPRGSSNTSTGSTRSKSSSGLRRGKWTVEEEAYVARVIQDFNAGFLNAPAGTTLRSYLSDKLHCDPMRITKKFTGDSCIGKRVFHPAVRCSSNAATIDKAQAELEALERRWRRRLEMQQRESAKKAAASAAAAAAVASGRSHPSLHANQVQGLIANQKGTHAPSAPQHVVARTATWLDRANAVLAPQTIQTSTTLPGQSNGMQLLPASEIESQMIRVQQLIHEGPIIQQTTAGLPHFLDHGDTSTQSLAGRPPVDKRPRTNSTTSMEEEQDAEALVGFLKSVHASTSTHDLAG